MDKFAQLIGEVINFFTVNVLEPIRTMKPIDVIDVVLLTCILYMVIRFLSNRRAGKLVTGCLLIVGFFVIAEAADMHAMKYILSNFYQVGFIAIIIIFQGELRSALEKVGGFSSKIVSGIAESADKQSNTDVGSELKEKIESICDAVFSMADSCTGALIVIERDTKVGEYMDGTKLDAEISSALIQNIFVNKAPLHDGAMIIRDMRIAAAACHLPLTSRKVDEALGTRHRAAIGLSEYASDALVIVVSEETGIVSLCHNSEIKRNYSRDKLSKELMGRLGKAKKKSKKTSTRAPFQAVNGSNADSSHSDASDQGGSKADGRTHDVDEANL